VWGCSKMSVPCEDETPVECAIPGIFFNYLAIQPWGGIGFFEDLFDPEFTRQLRMLYRVVPPDSIPDVPPIFKGTYYLSQVKSLCSANDFGQELDTCILRTIGFFISELDDENPTTNPGPQGGRIIEQAMALLNPIGDQTNRQYLRPLKPVMKEWVVGLREPKNDLTDSTFVAGASEFFDEAEARMLVVFNDCYLDARNINNVQSRAVFNVGTEEYLRNFTASIVQRPASAHEQFYELPVDLFGDFIIDKDSRIMPKVDQEMRDQKELQDNNFEEAYDEVDTAGAFLEFKDTIRAEIYNLYIEKPPMIDYLTQRIDNLFVQRFDAAWNIIQPQFSHILKNAQKDQFQEDCQNQGFNTIPQLTTCLKDFAQPIEDARTNTFNATYDNLKGNNANVKLKDREYLFRQKCLLEEDNIEQSNMQNCVQEAFNQEKQRLNTIFNTTFNNLFSPTYDFLREDIQEKCATGYLKRNKDVQDCISNEIDIFNTQTQLTPLGQTIESIYDGFIREKNLSFHLSPQFKNTILVQTFQEFENEDLTNLTESQRQQVYTDITQYIQDEVNRFLNERKQTIKEFYIENSLHQKPITLFDFFKRFIENNCTTGVPGQSFTAEQMKNCMTKKLQELENVAKESSIFGGLNDINSVQNTFVFLLPFFILYNILLILIIRAICIENRIFYDKENNTTEITKAIAKVFNSKHIQVNLIFGFIAFLIYVTMLFFVIESTHILVQMKKFIQNTQFKE